MKQVKTPTPVAMTLLEKIAAFLKLDDTGRVEKFFSNNVKEFNSNIKVIKGEIKRLELGWEIKVESFTQKLEDAKEAVDAAYMEVDVERIKSNTDIDTYKEMYWSNVQSKVDAIVRLKKSQEEAKETFEKEVEEFNGQIANFESRIKAIS